METSFFSSIANNRLLFGLVTAAGMALCSAGIGKAARLGAWVHPLSIAGYALGVLALILAAQGIFRWHVLPVTNEQALLGLLGIAVVKVLLAALYGA